MVPVKVNYGIMLTLAICLLASSCKGGESNSAAMEDTSVLARTEVSFTINSNKPSYQVQLSSTGEKRKASKKVWMEMRAAKVLQNPDGVYEVYLTEGSVDFKSLSPSHPGFVNLLDLYVLTGNNPAPKITINLSKILIDLSKDGQALPPLHLTILFRGNKSEGGQESKLAGELEVKSIAIVQED